MRCGQIRKVKWLADREWRSGEERTVRGSSEEKRRKRGGVNVKLKELSAGEMSSLIAANFRPQVKPVTFSVGMQSQAEMKEFQNRNQIKSLRNQQPPACRTEIPLTGAQKTILQVERDTHIICI